MPVNRRKDSIPVSKSHPHLIKEWHPTLNALTPDNIAAGGKHIIWWIGKLCGHIWDANIRNRAVKNHGCPYCSNQRLLVDYNDMATTHPVLAQEWHPLLNGELTPRDIQAGTARKVWWYREQCGHSWESAVNKRAGAGAGCHVCTNRVVALGVNDFATLFPELSLEWDDCNILKPHEVTKGNRTVIWWKCKSGHRWEQSISTRAKRQAGCPVCDNRKVLTGFNDLATTHPELATEWDHAANKIGPDMVYAGSHEHAHWICKVGHKWKATISHRSYSKTGCPVCTNRVIVDGFNDLAALHPKLAKEWHPTKNTKAPNQVGAGYVYSAWWQCSKNATHIWKSTVTNRVKGNGCPRCKGNTTSKVEQSFRTYLSDYLNLERVDHLSYVNLPGYKRKVQVDILASLLNRKIVVEYDGNYYHKNTQTADLNKTKTFLSNGYIVVRIRENGLPFLPIKNDHLLQIDYSWSLDLAKVSVAGTQIVDWIKSLEL